MSAGYDGESGTRNTDPIAIVGISCRLPGATSPRQLFQSLRSGTDSISRIPDGRLDAMPDYDPETFPAAGLRGGFLDSVDTFDADFFGISPREAAAMDPQQRLMLELGWEAFEDAGMAADRFRDTTTGVFVGAIGGDYATVVHDQGPAALTPHSLTGLLRGGMANRVSYALGLRGPSFVVDSGQSSSLVAVHLAAESMRRGECGAALAGGISLILTAEGTLAVDGAGALSPDGRCHTFDSRANGYVRGEGGGAVLLRFLSDAVADGDPVYCVLAGGAVNNDGGGAGFTVPDQRGQEAALRLAYRHAGLRPSDVDYVELHGTGTATGDPVEAAALGAVLGSARPKGSPLRVGSVKTNIGHLEGAAGIAGLLKAVLCLHGAEFVPSLNFETQGPRVPLDALNLRIQLDAEEWNTAESGAGEGDTEERNPGRPRVAGVSSFGIGGTNCHLVLAEYAPRAAGDTTADDGAASQEAPSPAAQDAPLAWVLSGRTPDALRDQAAALSAWLAREQDTSAADVAFSLSTTRTAFRHRAAVLGSDRAGLLDGLASLADGASATALVQGEAPDTTGPVFVFPGQGTQWAGMALELMESSPAFARALAECDAALRPFVEWSLPSVLRGEPGAPGLDGDDVVQPVLFAVMVSLARLWTACGVRPSAVVGHSQGEIAAAVVAGALSLDDGARVVALRSRALARLAGHGGLMAVALPVERTEELLREWGDELCVAAVNGPSSTVVAGARTVLDELTARCREEGVRVRRVPIDYASHSPAVERIRDEMYEALAPVVARPATTTIVSSVTGEAIEGTELDADYWYRNLRGPVRFDTAVRRVLDAGHRVLVEVSPHPVLTVGMAETVEDHGVEAEVLPTLRRDDGGWRRYLGALARAHTHGVAVDWPAVLAAHRPARVALPTYAFQRRVHWSDGGTATFRRSSAVPGPASLAGVPREDPRARDDDATGAGPTLRRRLAKLTRAGRRQALVQLVREEAAVVLGHDGPDGVLPALTFRELGFDSVLAVELRDRYASVTGLQLPTGLLFDHPTPDAVADRFAALLAEGGTDGGTEGGTAASGAVARAVDDDPIAIVAMGCRLPGGVRSPEEFWSLLTDEGDAVAGFPTDRGWRLDRLPDAVPRRGGFLYDAADFDAALFGISPREAAAMDPQQRILLETVWETFERAAVDPARLPDKRVGVFVGAMSQDYGPRLHEAGEDSRGHVLTGTTASVLSGRVAYAFGLEGPAVTVDTACSSSLVALHLAARSLREGECGLAVAAGVTVMANPGIFVEFATQHGMSPDGRCKAFSAAADGTGWAEGAGVLLLERLSDARRRGHEVLAVLRGSAVNSDGASNGLTAPNGPSQQRAIRDALTSAGLAPGDVDAVEAHGTGTVLGDPIEAQALLATYGQERELPLWLGSVKSNIGHTQAAAGLTGVIKMVLAMRHATLPRTLHVDEPTAHVDWSEGGMRLLTEARRWPETGRPRRAGVSSFGISGTNAHVVLEQADGPEPAGPAAPMADAPHVPMVLSAAGPEALRDHAARLAAVFADEGVRPADVALSLATARTALPHRAALVAGTAEEARAALAALASGEPFPSLSVERAGADTVAFLFSGQGSQRLGMGRELHRAFPVFAERFDEVCAEFDALLDRPLAGVIAAEADLLDRTAYTQAALFAVEVALFRLLEHWGIRPDLLAGHSIGELAAAHVAGVWFLPDACAVVAARGRLMQALPGGGAMVAVAVPEAEMRTRLREESAPVDIASVNGPSSVVLSGAEDAVLRVAAEFADRGVRTRRLAVSHPFHSSLMEPMLDGFAEVLRGIRFAEPSVPLVSNVTGALAGAEILSPEYWVRHVRESVRFSDGIAALRAEGATVFVELGPDAVLTGLAEETLADEPGTVLLPALRRDRSEVRSLLTLVGRLHARGVRVDWPAYFAGTGARGVALPTYPFHRQRYWRDSEPAAGGARSTADDEFWAAVDRSDVAGLSSALGVDSAQSFDSVVPALASWRADREREAATDAWRYRVTWRPVAPGERRAGGSCLLVVPTGDGIEGLVASVEDALTAEGVRVRRLDVDAFATSGDAAPADDDVRARVSGPLRGVLDEERPDTVLSLLAWTSDAPAEATTALLRALVDLDCSGRLWCLTRNAVHVDDPAGGDRPAEGIASAPYPDQAQVWGLGRVAALEHPALWGGVIDLPDDPDGRVLGRLGRLLARPGDEDQLALRGSGVHARRLVPLVAGRRDADALWRPTGTVLITGGTGALGTHVARWAVRLGAEHVLLTSRAGREAPGAADLEAELTALGARVSVVACDVADREALRRTLAAVPEDLPLTAVLHTAGVVDDGLLADMTPDRLRAVSAPKVTGTRNLHELTRDADLSAFVLFSSFTGVMGNAGQANYAAANAYLDAFARHRAAQGLVATSVAWGPWAGAGMAGQDAAARRMRRLGLGDLAPEAALDVLHGLIGRAGAPATVVADIDFSRLLPALTTVRPDRLFAEIRRGNRDAGAEPTRPSASARDGLRGELAALPAPERTARLAALVRAQAAAVLGHAVPEAVDTARAFRDQGFDSLGAVEFRNRLVGLLDLDLPRSLVFDHPSPDAVARHLAEDHFDGSATVQALSRPTAVTDDDPVAVVAMACRFPAGIASPEDLWRLLTAEGEVLGDFPADRGWDLDALYHPDPANPGTSHVRVGGFLDSATEFDAEFFGISPREALAMDPQQRLLLEVAWEAVERSGIDPSSLRGSDTGVFVGTNGQDYATRLRDGAEDTEGHIVTGVASSVLSGRVAYTLGLEGPAVSVDTACSSSLVALHLATRALRNGECSLALAGGATVMSTPDLFVGFSRQGGLAGDGRCKAFDADADGTGWGEGVGLVLLERLSQARHNGHQVLALIAGSAINQDGASNGLSAPNGPAQQRVIRTALTQAGLTPTDIDAVEAHGTGTTLGDPIEAQALLATYGQNR
ncbi:type I polyketide synthase, partial [Streptomyces sp. NPDC059092]|uniref:type I polyketide synthase n=1 Tax=Streptomyces sp. NPDC059092 TaxID=3346725 RepID=UPI0036B402EE